MIPVLIVPILTRPELLYRMLGTVDAAVDRLVVIDNGRVVDPALVPKVATETTILSLPSNLGVAASWNLGIKVTPFAPWWLIANFDITWPPGALVNFATAARPDALVLSNGAPPWCAFAIGDVVVGTVGLFDEAFHPGYYEDNDLERRVRHAGLHVIESGIHVDHENSSTLSAGFQDRNTHTFHQNHKYYQRKLDTDDYSAGHWSLARRRDLTWD